MKRKGFIGIIWIAAIALAAVVGTFVFVPGVSSSIQSMIGIRQPCPIAPYDPNCFCGEDEERLNFMAFGNPKFVCEPKAKFIDPSASNWQQQSIDYAITKLTEAYPDCDMKTCEGGTWRVTLSSENFNDRVIWVECFVSDQKLANVMFYVKDGSLTAVSSPMCANLVEKNPTQSGEDAIKFEYIGHIACGTYSCASELFIGHADCNNIDGPIDGTVTYTLPEGKTTTNFWLYGPLGRVKTITQLNGFTTCQIVREDSTSVDVTCSADCTGTHGGFGVYLEIFADGVGFAK